MNSKATRVIGDWSRMQIRDHPFFCWAELPMKSIFLIAIKVTTNWHRRKNCSHAGLKFKSLFYKREKFLSLKRGDEGSRDEQRDRGKLQRAFLKESSCVETRRKERRESRECRSSHIAPAKKFQIP